MDRKKWFYEDFIKDRIFDVGSHTVSAQEIFDFARLFDPQPFHVDEVAAAQSIYRGIIASGWHTCSLMMRLVVDGLLSNAAALGSPGVDEVRWILPVRPGDTLVVSSTVIDAIPSRSKPDRGIINSIWKATNQNGEIVATVKGMGIFLKRFPSDSS